MSHDRCRQCGAIEPEPYKAITRSCSRRDCPQRINKEIRKEFISKFTVPNSLGYKGDK